MKTQVFRVFAVLGAVAGAFLSGVSPTHAAGKAVVVVIAEGLSPALVELGASYLRVADDDAALSTSFDSLKLAANGAETGGNDAAEMQGLLATAAKNGYKTGLVTTGDIAAIAPFFYGLEGDIATALTAADAKYDFLAGGGRAHFGAETGERLKASGGTYLNSAAALDGDIQGRVLAAQADADLDFAIDRDPTQQAGLGELATLALDTLGAGDAPFVLVIHDTLVKKAIENRDTPALFEQFRELNAVLADVVARRDDNPDLGLAVWMTGSQNTPRFTTDVEAEQQNALFILSNLSLSYAGAGKALQGADNDAITAIADPEDGPYKGLLLSPQTREQIIAGTLNPETAVRAAHEPALKFDFDGPAAAPLAYTLGFEAPDGLVAALQSVVAAPAR